MTQPVKSCESQKTCFFLIGENVQYERNRYAPHEHHSLVPTLSVTRRKALCQPISVTRRHSIMTHQRYSTPQPHVDPLALLRSSLMSNHSVTPKQPQPSRACDRFSHNLELEPPDHNEINTTLSPHHHHEVCKLLRRSNILPRLRPCVW